MIPFSKPTIGQEEIEASNRVDLSGWLAAGKETAAFEEEFSDYVGVKYAIFTNSCTSALKMAYKYFYERGERAVTYPKNTFCATYSAAEELGMKTYAQEDLRKGYIDIGHAVVIGMTYGGVRNEHSICTIEDSAHRIEANDPLEGQGTYCAIRCYSFYATKNMTTRTGGMFVTNDKAIYERARLFWQDGLSTSTADRLNGLQGYRVEAMAGGYDNNDSAAAIGRVQLRRLPEFTKRRNDIVSQYNAAFKQSWKGNHLYPYFVKDEADAYRMIAYLKEKGIAAGHHYPGTGWNGVSLPLYPLLTDDEVSYIIKEAKGYDGI